MRPYRLQIELLNAARDAVKSSEEELEKLNENNSYDIKASSELATTLERNVRDLEHREGALGAGFLAYEKAAKDRLDQLMTASKSLTDETRHAEYLRVVVEAGPSAFATIEKALQEHNISLGEIMAKFHAARVNSATPSEEVED
jgi:Zn-finger domain-containing protein